jgi:hypothetical protein
MNMTSEIRTSRFRRNCLLALLCLSAGCWDSHPKQEAGEQAADGKSSLQKPGAATSAAADSAGHAAAEPQDELGFKHTLGPRSDPPKSASAPALKASQPGIQDNRDGGIADRYARSTPAPAYGNRPADVATDPPPLSPKMAEPSPRGTSEPARNRSELAPDGPAGVATPLDPLRQTTPLGDVLPTGNPLRDPGRSSDRIQPQAPSPAALPSRAASPLADRPQPAPRVEMVIQAKPDDTGPTQPAVREVEKKPQPKEHSAEMGGNVPQTAKNSGVPFDPIKVNGTIFEENGAAWPKPNLALVISGNQEGYLEPCGCAGLDRMKGGMSRRYTLVKQLRQKMGWPVVGLDVGNNAKGFGKQAELKFQIAVNAMNEMQYSSVTLGQTDLHLPTDYVMSMTIPAAAGGKTMFVAGNVGLFTFDETLLPRTQLIKAGFKTIGVTAVLGKTYSAILAGNANLKIEDPEKLLNQAVPLLKSKANYLILLANATHQEAVALAQKYPDFNLVVCSDGGAEPPNKPEKIGNGTNLVVVGEKGMYAVVLGFYSDHPLRYQRVTLDSRFASSPEMVALMAAYQDQLKDLGLSGLGIRPLDNPLKATNGDYVGSESCKSCHEESYRVWKKSPHSRAFATLKAAVPPRNFDPECVSCHTVGWHPTEFFPYKSGYLSEKETPKLINVGCEDCHGPGQFHVRAENQGTPAEQAQFRKASVITKEEMADVKSRKRNCLSCHDSDNSPEFKFDLYWPYVKHYEKQ